MVRRLCALFLYGFLMLCLFSARADFTLQDQSLELGIHRLHYPVAQSEEDPLEAAALNVRMQEALDIPGLTLRLSQVLDATVPLTASWEMTGNDAILSLVLSAEGPLDSSRFAHRWHTLNLTAAALDTITWTDLFAEPEKAFACMEAQIADEILPELSAHLMHADLLPLPDTFSLSPYGLTLYYPMERFQTLSDHAGAVSFAWYELRDFLLLDPGSILDQLQVNMHLGAIDREALYHALESGDIPGIPVRLGEKLTDVFARSPMAQDPDLCESGRLYVTEDSRMRGVSLLTDALSLRDYTDSTVQGIRTTRCNLYGLITGSTSRDQILSALGEASSTLLVTPDMAESMRWVPGTLDIYTLPSCRLQLLTDSEGILQMIALTL
ncbi:MAG: hypothetical protein IJ246_08880 [Clostridia bacterium]|nr:hypothetical protein [Clostridia bacterium]